MENKKSIKKFVLFIIFVVIIVVIIVGLDKQAQSKAVAEFPRSKANSIAKQVGVDDFEYYAERNSSGKYIVKIRSESFKDLSNEDKMKVLRLLDESDCYYGLRGIISGGDVYTFFNYYPSDEYRLEKNDEVIYEEYYGKEYSGSSSGSGKCSHCGGRGKKVVAFYEYGDWGDVSYSTYDCPYC